MADSDLLRIETAPDTPYPLGRHVWHDPQNRQHRALARRSTLPDRNRTWYSPDPAFDQRGSSCTFQSNIRMLRTSPFRASFTQHWPLYDSEAERHAGYLLAQNYDPWAGGEPQYEGSSSDAPLKLLRERGQIGEWKWLFGFDEVQQWLGHFGPCVVGTTWYNSMFDVDASGYISIDDTKGSAGGHAYALVGRSATRKASRVFNSWGSDWGYKGRAWIRDADLKRLLEDQGEAVTLAV